MGTAQAEFRLGMNLGKAECVLYMYGPDADALFSAIEPVCALRRSPRCWTPRHAIRGGERP